MATAVGAKSPVDPNIIQQLQVQILPFIIRAERLWRRPEYLAFSVYSYLRAVLAAVVGAGISAPILNFLNSLTSAAPESSQATRAGIAQVPEGLTWVGLSIVVLLIGVQTYFAKREVEKRWVLAQSCRKEFRGLNTRAVQAMGSPDVVNQLAKIRNEVSTIYGRHYIEDSWPYPASEPGIDPLVEARLRDMVKQLETNPKANREIDQEEL